MDNDEIIDMFDRNPTYGRKPETKSAIREMQQNAAIKEEKAAEAPRAAQPKRSTSGTIDFGSNP